VGLSRRGKEEHENTKNRKRQKQKRTEGAVLPIVPTSLAYFF
jgi:hypothetical protein